MTDPNTAPIVVNPDQTMAQLGVALRYFVTGLGGYLVGKGWIDGELLQVIVAGLTALAPAVYAAYRSHQQKKALVTVAAAAPNTVAVVKGTEV
jgi:hypothetical protein